MERKSAKPMFQVVLNTHRLKSNDLVNKKNNNYISDAYSAVHKNHIFVL